VRKDVVGGAAVAGDRHIVEDGKTQERLHVDVVRLRRERVPEEEDGIDAGHRDHLVLAAVVGDESDDRSRGGRGGQMRDRSVHGAMA
jgi:hypothetical protein